MQKKEHPFVGEGAVVGVFAFCLDQGGIILFAIGFDVQLFSLSSSACASILTGSAHAKGTSQPECWKSSHASFVCFDVLRGLCCKRD